MDGQGRAIIKTKNNWNAGPPIGASSFKAWKHETQSRTALLQIFTGAARPRIATGRLSAIDFLACRACVAFHQLENHQFEAAKARLLQPVVGRGVGPPIEARLVHIITKKKEKSVMTTTCTGKTDGLVGSG